MSFTLDLTDDQQALRERTHAFARDVIRPVASEYDRAQEFPWPVLEAAAQEGLYDWRLYAELSLDPTGLSLPIVMEELFWGCAGIGLSIVMPALALAAIRQAATDEQLARWAPECFGTPGDIKLAALAVTEPSGGSDVRSIQTRARKDGDDWVIHGQKVFIGNGGIADVHVVVATVDPEAGHRGQGVFVVPKGTPGLKMLRKLDKLGCRASHTGELVFEDCRVPAENILGEEGRGFYAIMRNFQNERLVIGAMAIGEAQTALAITLDWVRSRKAFGATLWDKQATRQKLASLAAKVEAGRQLVYATAWRVARGEDCTREVSMVKAYCGELVNEVLYACVQCHGGMGFMRGTAIERMARDVRVQTIGGGATEVMLEEVAKRM
jgi:acyl-CoA dehydrogenase